MEYLLIAIFASGVYFVYKKQSNSKNEQKTIMQQDANKKLSREELVRKTEEGKHLEPQDDYFVSGAVKNKSSKTRGNSYRKLTGKNAVLNSFVVFDFETTGLSADFDEILEIGAIRIDNINRKAHKTFNSLVKPSKPISSRITKINGIDNNMVADADHISEVIKEFHAFIGDLPLIAHNASFDMKFLLKNLETHGLEFSDNQVVDTLSISRQAFPHLENHKLPTLVDHIGIKVKQLHRASDDSLAALQVYTVSMQLLYGAYK